MDDPELEAIRRARMAELQSGRGEGGASRGGSGYPQGGMGGGGGAGGMGGEDGAKQQEAEAQEEMKRQALSTILDSDARERCESRAFI